MFGDLISRASATADSDGDADSEILSYADAAAASINAASKKITIKVNGKTFSAKTNSKGVASIKVKVTKKGKFTATAKFAGDNTYKGITKKARFTVK